MIWCCTGVMKEIIPVNYSTKEGLSSCCRLLYFHFIGESISFEPTRFHFNHEILYRSTNVYFISTVSSNFSSLDEYGSYHYPMVQFIKRRASYFLMDSQVMSCILTITGAQECTAACEGLQMLCSNNVSNAYCKIMSKNVLNKKWCSTIQDKINC